MSTLSIENVSMRFDIPDGSHIQALKDITLELKTGELMSVLGPSGCGKSTLLNIVAGFMAPTEGKLTLNEVPITKPGAERGMVFQQGALFDWMSVRENVSFGPRMADNRTHNTVKTSITCSMSSACRTSRARPFTNSRAACSSAWRWPAAWPTTRTSS